MSQRLKYSVVAASCMIGAVLLFVFDDATMFRVYIQKTPSSESVLSFDELMSDDAVTEKRAAELSNIELWVDDLFVSIPWVDLGITINSDETLLFDRNKALITLLNYRNQLSREAKNARLDLEHRSIASEIDGFDIDIYASLLLIKEAAEQRRTKLILPSIVRKPSVTQDKFESFDVSHVMGEFRTSFNIEDNERNDNMKRAALRISGHILLPQEEFSFNKIVGPRTRDEGYKIAPIISSREIVDGIGGGICQVSTTLHGAVFFSGLEIVESKPHSRPSIYAPMGFDSTVVYPSIDFKFRNPYDFPVVILYRIAQGEMMAQILGPKRPYDQIKFVRTITKEHRYNTVIREDSKISFGNYIIDQDGYPGYWITTSRQYYQNDTVVKTESWNWKYTPVIEYIRIGINFDPDIPIAEQKNIHTPKLPAGIMLTIVQ